MVQEPCSLQNWSNSASRVAQVGGCGVGVTRFIAGEPRLKGMRLPLRKRVVLLWRLAWTVQQQSRTLASQEASLPLKQKDCYVSLKWR